MALRAENLPGVIIIIIPLLGQVFYVSGWSPDWSFSILGEHTAKPSSSCQERVWPSPCSSQWVSLPDKYRIIGNGRRLREEKERVSRQPTMDWPPQLPGLASMASCPIYFPSMALPSFFYSLSWWGYVYLIGSQISPTEFRGNKASSGQGPLSKGLALRAKINI